jgi:uncharacterized membrane protein YqaE (UPF0057 family)
MEATRKSDSTLGNIFRMILSLIIPPIGVFMEVGFSVQFFVNILLTLLGYFPGVIHAAYIIGTR